MRNPDWVKDELILALDLYKQLGLKEVRRLSKLDERIVDLGNVLNNLPLHTDRPDAPHFRSPDAVRMKLNNFLRLDPDYEGKGLQAGAIADEEVWTEFSPNLPRLRLLADAIKQRANSDGLQPAQRETFPAQLAEFEAPEGRVLFREHTLRERNATLVKKKKKYVLQIEGTLQCEVCGFNFANCYGEIGEGYIECHHTKPISQLSKVETTKSKDLSLVCANCHRMLHVGGELLSIPALKKRMTVQPSP